MPAPQRYVPAMLASRPLPEQGTKATVNFIGARAGVTKAKEIPYVMAIGRIEGGDWDGEDAKFILLVQQHQTFWSQAQALIGPRFRKGAHVSAEDLARLLQGRRMQVTLRPELRPDEEGHLRETGRVSVHRLTGRVSPLDRNLHGGGTGSSRISAFKARQQLRLSAA